MDYFTGSVIKFILANELDGLDIDYESGSTLSKSDFINVISTLRKHFDEETSVTGKHYILSITADTTNGFDKNTKNRYVDFVGAQGYNYGSARSSYPAMENNILDTGVNPVLLLVGMNIEGSDKEASTDRVDDFVLGKNCAGVFGWRINCANQIHSLFNGVITMSAIMGRSSFNI